MRSLLIALALLTALPAVAANRLQPFTAEYRVYRGGSTLGAGVVSLEKAAEPDCYVYSYTAKPSWLLRLLTGSITERSEFCTEDGQLVARHYRYHRSGVGADGENYSLSFDPDTLTVTDDKGHTREYPQHAVDRLLVQLEALRLIEGLSMPPDERRLSVTLVEDDRIKTYTLGVTGSETIETKAGRFETFRVERLDDPKKSTRFWVAPALGDRLVKVEQQKKDDPVIGFELEKLPQSAGK